MSRRTDKILGQEGFKQLMRSKSPQELEKMTEKGGESMWKAYTAIQAELQKGPAKLQKTEAQRQPGV